jgi:carbon-monoxide dehydrogenase medium subunit
MNAFDYHRPATITQAAEAIVAGNERRFLAGGQSLLPAMKFGLSAPEGLVDLGRIPDLKGITRSGQTLRVGAMTSHAAVAASADVLATIPALAQVADGIGDPAVRSRGTLGGSLGLNDPAACYPAAVLGLGATVHTNRRTIPADAFFKGLYETALDAGELITAVEFPVPQQAAWMKFKQPASRFSLVGVFVSRGPAGVRVAVTGAGACAFRVPQLEAALTKSWSAAACEGVKVSADGLNTDLHASAAYRAHLITVLARRAVAAAG